LRGPQRVSAIGQGGEIVGYYTFAATALALGDLTPALAKKLPRYPSYRRR
jgi:hypothetical protein